MGDVQMTNTDSLLQVDENAHEQVTCVTILLMKFKWREMIHPIKKHKN